MGRLEICTETAGKTGIQAQPTLFLKLTISKFCPYRDGDSPGNHTMILRDYHRVTPEGQTHGCLSMTRSFEIIPDSALHKVLTVTQSLQTKYRFNFRSASTHRLMQHHMTYVQAKHLKLQTKAMKIWEILLPVGFLYVRFEQLVNAVFLEYVTYSLSRSCKIHIFPDNFQYFLLLLP